MSKNTKFGVLYIVATPIGNLEDISKRAVNTLSNVSLCAVENTRNSKKLMNKYNIHTKMISYHKYSEESKLDLFISQLKSGNDIALISDAGTPLISDPGYLLVNKAIDEGVKVVPIPGPSSLISALSVSGLPSDKFAFYGFPPRQKKALKALLIKIVSDEKTSVVFEAKSRIKESLKTLVEISPDRNIFLAREMTKLYETFYKGSARKVLEEISLNQNEVKGEFVLVIEGKTKGEDHIFLNKEQEKVLGVLMQSMDKNEALNLASKSFGIKKNSLYKLLLKEN